MTTGANQEIARVVLKSIGDAVPRLSRGVIFFRRLMVKKKKCHAINFDYNCNSKWLSNFDYIKALIWCLKHICSGVK